MGHCWKDYREHLEDTGQIHSDEWVATHFGGGKTCMLEDGHECKHDFSDDDEIVVTFADRAIERHAREAR